MVIKGVIEALLGNAHSAEDCPNATTDKTDDAEQSSKEKDLQIERQLWGILKNIEEVQEQYRRLKGWVDLGLLPETGEDLLDHYMIVRKVDEAEYDSLREQVRLRGIEIPDEIFYEAYKCAERTLPTSGLSELTRKHLKEEMINKYIQNYIDVKAAGASSLDLTEKDKLQYAAEHRLWATLEQISDPNARWRAFREWDRLGLFPLTRSNLIETFTDISRA